MRVAHLIQLICTCVAAAELSAADAFRVTGGSAEVFAAPGGSGEPVCTVSEGESLRTTGRTAGDWVQVEVPEGCRLYVYSRLVSEDVVKATRLRVRSGPGIAFPAVGEVEKGCLLKVYASEGDWLSIEAPPGCNGWISRQRQGEAVSVSPRKPLPMKPVEPDPEPIEKPESIATPKPENSPSFVLKMAPMPAPVPDAPATVVVPKAPAKPDARPAPPVVRAPAPKPVPKPVTQPPESAVVLQQLAVQDEWQPAKSDSSSRTTTVKGGAIRGLLAFSGRFQPPAAGAYRLVSDSAGAPRTVCWLTGAIDPRLLGRVVEVDGSASFQQGVRHPWVRVKSMRAVSR